MTARVSPEHDEPCRRPLARLMPARSRCRCAASKASPSRHVAVLRAYRATGVDYRPVQGRTGGLHDDERAWAQDGGEPHRTTIDTPSDACHRALSLRHTHGSTAFWRARIDRSGLGQISVALPVIPAILRCEVAAGWPAFVAVSGLRR